MRIPSTSSRKPLTGIVGITAAALLLTACGSGDDAGEESGLDTVSVQLDYQIRGNHGMFYVADELGYFEEEGIDVEDIRTGTGSPDALRIVGDGGADFGFGDLPSLVTARSQGVPVKALAVVNQSSPLGMCTVAERTPLDDIDDLRGLTAGIHAAGSTFIFYETLLAANGMERDDLDEVSVTPPYENYLIQDRVDTVPCYIDAEVPQLEDAAGGEGSLDVLLGSEHGYEVYGSGLFASDDMIKDNPDLVQRFTDAYLRAFQYVVEHPEETATLLSEVSPELAGKADLFERQLQADIDHTFSNDLTEEQGLGAMDEATWQSTVDTLADQGALDGEPPATSDVYDPTFVEAHKAGS
jgi:NitT/TauT family transport system substrate-binding protein